MFNSNTTTYLQKFKNVALAISGGIDSMCLLFSYERQRGKLPNFVVINVHHNLRGAEGLADSDFVKDYCSKRDIPCIFFDEDIPTFCKQHGYGAEQGARIKRQEIFNKLVADHLVDRVLTAHHLGDQTESVLMHIFRGTGINGLCGMSFDNGTLIRPFINISKNEIIDYAHNYSIKFVTDSSNASTEYTRNKLRLDIIPELNKIYGNLDVNIARLSTLGNQIKSYVNSLCPTPFIEKSCVKIKVEWLANRDFISAELIARAVDCLAVRTDLTSEHINKIYDLANSNNSQQISLPFGITAYKEYEFIAFAKTECLLRKTDFSFPFELGEFDCGNWQIIINNFDNGGLVCDYNSLNSCVLRKRKVGDTFKKFGGGTKSLGDFLTDKKIPKRIRDNIIVIANDSQILAMPPYEISDTAKITDKTKNKVYILALEKN